MGSLYTAVTTSNYNSNPPSDDGSQTAPNRVQWSTQKTKLTDPIKTAYDTSETNTAAAFAKTFGAAGITSTSLSYTVAASDQGKLVKVTGSGGVTITTPDATSVNSPFTFALLNDTTGSITFAGNNPGVQQNVDDAASITIPSGNGLICMTDGTNWFTAGQNFTKSFPPPSSFKNLSVKVTGNTGVTIAADYITVTDGSKYQTLAFNQAINMASTGAGALDTGSIASATFYAIWAIAKADGTTSAIASTSGSSPTMPSGYTYKARAGWVLTAGGAAQLMGTYQFGKRVQYVVGLAQTATIQILTSGIAGTMSSTSPVLSSVSVSGLVPSTASEIHIAAFNNWKAAGVADMMVAPNTSWGGTNHGPNGTAGNIPPIYMVNNTATPAVSATMVLESTNIAWASDNGGGAVAVLGWTDNI